MSNLQTSNCGVEQKYRDTAAVPSAIQLNDTAPVSSAMRKKKQAF